MLFSVDLSDKFTSSFRIIQEKFEKLEHLKPMDLVEKLLDGIKQKVHDFERILNRI
jgi:hypothetical protein